jgi:CBS domain-containing protein
VDIDGNDMRAASGRRRTTVSDVMTRGVLSVGPDAPFAEIATVLSTGAVRAVPVLDEDRRLLGVVSEADLLVTVEREVPVNGLRRWRPRHTRKPGPVAKVGARTARELMTAAAVTVAPGTTLARAARTMRERGLSWLPVVDTDGRIAGVLGRSDLLSVFMRDDAAIRAEIIDGVLLKTMLIDPARIDVDVADGVVTMTGRLDTPRDAELAVRLVESVEGVVDVVNRLS